jgi:3-phosphoshikimate 1-carboxyvinyltransferase
LESRYLTASNCKSLSGNIEVPGDKSISHRALIFASQAIGTSRISNLLESQDVLNTMKSLQKLGCGIEKQGDDYVVKGVSLGGLKEADDFLDFGNSGTGARLMMGLLASHNFRSFMTGDDSLRGRPMSRVINPLAEMGAVFHSRDGKLPILLEGSRDLMPIEYELPVASAQVKSAILLAAMNVAGITTIIENERTRDHTELMMEGLGLDIKTYDKDGKHFIELQGQNQYDAQDFQVPGDPSSAAFPIVAALITESSKVIVNNVMINPLRAGLFDVLQDMGANLQIENKREASGEIIADITAEYSKLRGVEVAAEKAPSMIDEYPILSIAAACAEGETIMHGLAELRVKESNRLDAIRKGLSACGIETSEKDDSLTVIPGNEIRGGCEISTHGDHRIAMSFLVAGLAAKEAIKVNQAEMIETSFPGFAELMQKLGADIS